MCPKCPQCDSKCSVTLRNITENSLSSKEEYQVSSSQIIFNYLDIQTQINKTEFSKYISLTKKLPKSFDILFNKKKMKKDDIRLLDFTLWLNPAMLSSNKCVMVNPLEV